MTTHEAMQNRRTSQAGTHGPVEAGSDLLPISEAYLQRSSPLCIIICGLELRLCCKNSRRSAMGRKLPFLLSLGRHSKQTGDEGDLSLANHVHDLIPMPRSPCCFYGKEAHPCFDQTFDEPMVLLDQVLQVVDQALVRHLGRYSGGFERGLGFGRGRILLDVDHARGRLRGGEISQSRGRRSPALGPDAPQELNQLWRAAL
jgi:hypothetical protein